MTFLSTIFSTFFCVVISMSKPIFKSSFSDSNVVVNEELVTTNFCFLILKTSNFLLAVIELITIYNLKLID
jgi:hypothetical protein